MVNALDRPTSATSSNSAEHSGSSNLLGDAFGWTADNVGKPLVNAALITPCNAVGCTVDAVTGTEVLPELGYLAVPKANFLSPGWFAQGVSGGVGMIGPYLVAGRLTGGAMRWSGETLGVEGRAAEILQNGKIAQIAGAGIYDGMREPGQGETRLGNSLAGMSMFGVFEYGNALGKNLNFAEQIGKRAAVGFTGATAQQTVSHLVSERNLPTFDQYLQSGIGGAVLNVALPPTQHALLRTVDGVNHSLGRGVPIDRYSGAQNSLSNTFNETVSRNPWARVQDGSAQDAAVLSRKLVQLQGTEVDQAKLGHELYHLQTARDASVKAGYDQAAALLNLGKSAEARDLFFKTHMNTELNARAVESTIGRELGVTSQTGNLDVQTLANKQSHDGQTYLTDTEQAFQRFAASNGKVRPDIEYGGTDATPIANNNIPRPRVLLARGEGEGDIYDNGDGKVTKIYYDKTTDVAAKRAMYARLDKMGIKVPKTYDHGTTADGQPALVMDKIGDGDSLKMQLFTGELSPADRVSIRKQYYAMGDLLEKNGVTVDWNLGNMRYENGTLYLLDPSFIKETPLPKSFVDMFGSGLGPRL